MKDKTCRWGALGLAAWAGAAPAQTAPTAPPPAPAPDRVEVTTRREGDLDQRRTATAAKTVIGRDEIERFGDTTLGEVLRRLPGVTTPGAPGRGGPPRLRGLGNGYTQLLLDGQRMPPGFSLESIPPEQVERIEILRAPTAETGAQAIAGTLNIVLREGFRRRANEVRTGVALENGALTPGLFWNRSDGQDRFSYSTSVSAFDNHRRTESRVDTTDVDAASGETVARQRETATTHEQRPGVHASARLQWRLDEGATLVLSPNLFHNESRSERDFASQALQGSPTVGYDSGRTTADGDFSVARSGAQWRTVLAPDTRLELNGSAAASRGTSASHRQELLAGNPVRTLDDRGATRERTLAATAKLSHSLGGDAAVPGSEHQLVAGWEAESTHRAETRRSWQDGTPLLQAYDPTLRASSLRLAAYAQDEWALNAHWAAHAGARWESLETRGDGEPGSEAPRNQSRVFSPLLHAVWKPDPKGRDQVRMSLTRSYRAPSTGTLIARPTLSTRFPVDVTNDPTSPDRAGNPDLKPELATGIDLAFERYLAGGGLLSANVFHRRIRDLMRSVTGAEPETVPWSTAPRYVARQRNIGRASTEGVELESRFALDQWLAEAPRVELRANLAFYRSRVDSVPGPDNRLDQQARATGNLGADYRFRGGALAPLAVGGNLNWVPRTETQAAADQRLADGGKRQFDLYALWTFHPALALRLLASNAAPRDYETTNTVATATVVETAQTTGPTDTNWQLRLEFKL